MPWLCFCLNGSTSQATQLSPHQVLYGHNLNSLPGDALTLQSEGVVSLIRNAANEAEIFQGEAEIFQGWFENEWQGVVEHREIEIQMSYRQQVVA